MVLKLGEAAGTAQQVLAKMKKSMKQLTLAFPNSQARHRAATTSTTERGSKAVVVTMPKSF